jgi:hypothetical protein
VDCKPEPTLITSKVGRQWGASAVVHVPGCWSPFTTG